MMLFLKEIWIIWKLREVHKIKRPLLFMTGAWILGEVLALEKTAWIAALPVLVCAGFWLFGSTGRRHKAAVCLWAVLLFLAGFGRTGMFLSLDPLMSAMEQAQEESAFVSVRGRIERMEYKGDQTVLYLKNTSVHYRKEDFREPRLLIYAKEIPELKIGNEVQAEGSLHRFLPPRNPGEFDQQAYYGALHLQACLYGEEIHVEDAAFDVPGQLLHVLRIRLTENLIQAAGPKEGGVLACMLLGDKAQLDPEIKELYQGAGLAALLAISGLHVSFLGMGLYCGLRRLGLSYALSFLTGGAVMICYGVMIGGSQAAVRAIIMFCIALAGDCLGRSYDLISAACAAALVMLWQSPLLLTQCGFLLSFGAVGAIGLVSSRLEGFILGARESGKDTKRRHLRWALSKVLRALITGISIQIVSLPVTAWYFYQAPAYGIFLNLMAIPLMGLVLVSGGMAALLGFFPGGGFLGTAAAGGGVYLLRFYERLCELAVSLPAGQLLFGRPEIWQLFLYVIIWAAFFWRLWNARMQEADQKQGKGGLFSWKRAASLLCCLLLSAICLKTPPVSGLRMDFLDVGQGDGIVIQTAGHAVMVDGGSSDRKNVGKYSLEPFLKCRGIARLDYLVLTHCDGDHVNGALYLMEEGTVTIGTLVLPAAGLRGTDREAYEALADAAGARSIPVWWMKAGDSFESGGASFSCLYPREDLEPVDSNETSLVLRCAYEDFELLLTGDLGSQGEEILLEEGSLMQMDMLKVGHHGSKNSTKEAFLKAIDPHWAVISCGRDNRYGHPHEELLDRLAEQGVTWWATKDRGEIQITYQGGRLRIFGGK